MTDGRVDIQGFGGILAYGAEEFVEGLVLVVVLPFRRGHAHRVGGVLHRFPEQALVLLSLPAVVFL